MQDVTRLPGAEAPPMSQPAGGMDGPVGDPSASGLADPLADPRALQILTTEHWSLLATRSLAYNEAFTRASMFLTFVSASLIVVGFLVGAGGRTSDILPVIAILLLADLFIGLATLGRLVGASTEDLQCVRGMNRIRHAYREMVPGLEPYFVTGFHDDRRGVLMAYTGPADETSLRRGIAHGLTTTTGLVGSIDVLILAALMAVGALGLGAPLGVSIVVGIVAFFVGLAFLAVISMRTVMAREARAVSRFPTPDDTVR